MTQLKKNKQRNIPHDSALTHVAGTSEFIDDRPQVRGELIVGLLYAEVPSGILEHIDTQKAQKNRRSRWYLYPQRSALQYLGFYHS